MNIYKLYILPKSTKEWFLVSTTTNLDFIYEQLRSQIRIGSENFKIEVIKEQTK